MSDVAVPEDEPSRTPDSCPSCGANASRLAEITMHEDGHRQSEWLCADCGHTWIVTKGYTHDAVFRVS